MSEVSPLVEIEQLALERANERNIALDQDSASTELRGIVVELIEQWRADHRRGLRTVDLTEPLALADRAMQNLTGYGPLTSLLEDDDVWEVMINAPDAIFVKRHQGPSGYHHQSFHDDEHVLRTITRIVDRASSAHRSLDPTAGLQDAQLDNGSRLHIVHNDLARGGHMMVNIRKFTGMAFRRLDELVAGGTLTHEAALFLRACVQANLSTIFAGVPGAGKTTLLSCCASELDPTLRVVIAEEVFEADVPLPNVASMQTRGVRPDRPGVDLRSLVSGFLRMAPDVAIVGEVRDREALPLMMTLSSGVTGFTTIHAGSARQALTRLRFVCQLAESSNEIPMAALNDLVSQAIDVIVHSVRTPEGPRVNQIACVEDLSSDNTGTNFTITEVFRRNPRTGRLEWTGHLPSRASEQMEVAGIDLRSLVGDAPPPPPLPSSAPRPTSDEGGRQ
ncbi:MAG: CpaF family protein [Acidimicrobiales bacterium]